MNERNIFNNKVLFFVFLLLLVSTSIFLVITIKTFIGYVSVISEAGTITELIITQRNPTSNWQGFYGMALMQSGYTELQSENTEPGGLESKHLVFDCLELNIENEVYSSDVNPNLLDWGNIQAGNPAWADNYFNISPSDDDSITNTFTSTGYVMYGSQNITNVPMTYTKKLGNESSQEFDIGLLNVDGVPVFFTHIAEIQKGFNNQTLNYQIILPSPTASLFYLYSDPNDYCPEGQGTGVSGEGYINGVVTDSSTNQSIENVTIGISNKLNQTDASGFYNITAPIGYQYIVAVKDGYYTYTALVNITLAAQIEHNISMIPLTPTVSNGTIQGTVIDNSTDSPLENVTVHVAGATFTTDSNGFYNGSVYTGNYTIVALLNGYNNYISQATIVEYTTTIHNISMEPATGTVEGIVTDNSTGTLLSGVSVSISNQNTSTNISGAYSLTVGTGEHFIVATKAGYENYVENITVMPGQTIQYNITLIPTSLGELFENGTIIGNIKDNRTNIPLANVSVTIAGVTDLTDANGFYNISIFEGTYNFVAVKSGYENYISEVNITANNVTIHNVSMSPFETKFANGTLIGNVTNQQGIPIAGVSISIAGELTNSSSSGTYNMSVTSGTHNLVATRSGYENYIAQVVITQGNTTVHNIIMETSIVEIIQEFTGVGEGVAKKVEEQRPQQWYPKKEGKLNYEISTKKILRKLRVGSFLNIPITISNYKTEMMNLEISFDGDLDRLMRINKKTMAINPDSSEEFTVTLIGNVEVGIYEGNIIISGDIDEKIPVTVLVYSKEKLPIEGLLINLELLNTKVAPEDVLKYRVDLQNLLREEQYNISLTYKIKSGNNTEIIIGNDNVVIQTSFSLLKNFKIPKDFKPGEYVLTVEVKYLDSVLRQSSPFKVVLPFYKYAFIGIPLWMILAGALIIASLIFIFMLYKKKKEEKKRYRTKLNMHTLPQAGERSAFIGNIAETTTKAYLNMDNFQIHTLIAGASGGGKTVCAEDLVEEALMKNVSVIVFDPTAQWTGFLRKNNDKEILDLYPNFGMKRKDARAFNGNIHQVSDGREIIDFKKYMNPGTISIFLTAKLDMKNTELFVANTIREIFHTNLPESQELKYLLVYDGIHTLLPKFGGSGKVFVQLERAAREFRKWGVGLILISQVLSDFPKEVLANINTEMQTRTRDEGDLNRIKEEYGDNILKSVVKAATGTSMIESSAYNNGQPYFVSFRPPLHSLKRLSDDELSNYEKYNKIIEDLEYQIEQLKEQGIDIFDLELELKLAKDKINAGTFNMVSIYLEGLTPRIKAQWDKLGKTPKKKEIKLASEDELEKELEKAKKVNEESRKEQEQGKKQESKTEDEEVEEAVKEEAREEEQEEKEIEKGIEGNNLTKINNLMTEMSNCLDNGSKKEAIQIYNKITILYKEIPKEYKKEIFNKCRELYKRLM